ncbi:ABC transporter permease [Uniformispora flossi]|uniref:ABC transporter permease n=1 Tax=Uniformispora flossi TaxID=3390723 RepID=UPI003C2B6925
MPSPITERSPARRPRAAIPRAPDHTRRGQRPLRLFPAALHAEWTKLRTLSSTWWLLAAITAATVAAGAAATGALSAEHCPPPGTCDPDQVRTALTGLWIGQAIVAVLAVLTACNEYATGTIHTTLTAMPDRLRVLAAKAVLLAGITTATAVPAVGGSLLTARFMLPTRGDKLAHPGISLTDGATARAAIGGVLYLVAIALLSLGLALLLRDTAGATTTSLGLLYVFPLLAGFVNSPTWQDNIRKLGPASAGQSITATHHLDTLSIAPWPGLGVLALYAAAALTCGSIALCRRDA